MLLEEIKKTIMDAGYKHGDKMPSVRDMASQLGLSTSTIHKAYKELTDKGILKSYQGKGCFWGACPTITTITKTDTNSSIQAFFAKDLESGFINAFEKLPSIKELSIRYKTSPHSIKNFLTLQVSKGVLQHIGTKYFFNEERTVAAQNYILFVHRSNDKGKFLIEAEREFEVFRMLSRFAADQKISIRFVGYYAEKDTLFSSDGSEFIPKESPQCLGVFLSTWLVLKPTNLFAHFSKFTSPISVWWEYPPELLPTSTQNRKKWAFFNAAFGKEAGNIVGQHLKNKGILKAHYLSPFHASHWSKVRLEGIVEKGIEVIPLLNRNFDSPFDMQEAADKDGISLHDFLIKTLEPLLQGATLDAFVCSNDWVACTLIEICESKKIPRPYVIGFDDTKESYQYVFDSLAFNAETMVKEALYHIISPTIYASFRSQLQNPLGKVVVKS